MAHYVIFIPGASGMDPKPHLDRVGLGDLLCEGEPGPEVVEFSKGPKGSGLLMMWRRPDQTIGTDFEWRPAVQIDHETLGELPAERYYLGIDRRSPPQPADLVRPNPINGHQIKLNDGWYWTVPTISRLPNQYKLVDGGEINRVVKQKYARFYETGMKVIADIMDGYSLTKEASDVGQDVSDYSIELNLRDGLKFIASAIGLNYRVNWELVFLLELLDERSGAMAFLVFCELNEIQEASDCKKKMDPLSIPVGSVISSGKTG